MACAGCEVRRKSASGSRKLGITKNEIFGFVFLSSFDLVLYYNQDARAHAGEEGDEVCSPRRSLVTRWRRGEMWRSSEPGKKTSAGPVVLAAPG